MKLMSRLNDLICSRFVYILQEVAPGFKLGKGV